VAISLLMTDSVGVIGNVFWINGLGWVASNKEKMQWNCSHYLYATKL